MSDSDGQTEVSDEPGRFSQVCPFCSPESGILTAAGIFHQIRAGQFQSIGLFSIYAASFLSIGWGLSIGYLVRVNAVAHIVAAILWREMQSRFWTALILFVSLGTMAYSNFARVPGVDDIQHAAGITVAIWIHAAIVVYARQRRS